ncbi:MAG: hypothetical protein CVV27_02060 [Candidatus Melainabacteria bacterium HGW-Melainabacteria-1]|nr:MAG: hypothetical protein CVV27_02060 [Candidatus Melainabacteria bacterium HGW-Melainabacteria-1]
MPKQLYISIFCAFLLAGCQPPAANTAQPPSTPPESLPGASSTPNIAPASPDATGSQPGANPTPGPDGLPQASPIPGSAVPGALPPGLAGIRFLAGLNRFLDDQGESVNLGVELLNAAGQVLPGQVALEWSSSRPQDLIVDASGKVTALVDQGYTEIRVRVPGSSFEATTIINVNSTSGGNSGSSGQTGKATVPFSLTSESGSKGDTLEIRGEFLGGRDTILVRFGELIVPVLTAASTRLTVEVPDMPAGVVEVRAQEGSRSHVAGYTVLPRLSQLSTGLSLNDQVVIKPGGILTLNGSNFDPTPANNTVYLGDLALVPNSASPSQLTATIPAGLTTNANLPVSVKTDSLTSNKIDALLRHLVFDNFSPSTGAPGTIVTINGAGFSETTAVHFNGVPAIFTVVSPTQITATVPAQAIEGVITVFNGNSASSGTAFDAQRVIRVNAQVNTGQAGYTANGATWGNAYNNLQSALGMANAGDTIWIAQGTYLPHATEPTVTFQMKQNVNIYGGFASGDANLADRNPVDHKVILSGDLGNDDIRTVTPFTAVTPNSFNVIRGANSSRLDSVTIQGATSSGMLNNGVSPTLNRVVFAHNNASYGGGLRNISASPQMTELRFEQNHALSEGGGLFSSNSNITLNGGVFEGNVAGAGAGGMINRDGTVSTLSNLRFVNNRDGRGVNGRAGGLTYWASGGGSLENAVFDGNDGTAGAIYVERIDGELLIDRVVAVNNTGLETIVRFNIYAAAGTSSVVVRNLLVANNEATSDVFTVLGDTTDGSFVMRNATWANNTWFTALDGFNLHPVNGAAAFNAGVTDVGNPAPAQDIVGRNRIGNPEPGAYEYDGPIVP